MYLKNQRGAAPIIEIALIAVVLILAGTAIFNAIKHHDNTLAPAASPSPHLAKSPSPTPAATPSTSPTAVASDGPVVGSLNVTELGIKLPLTKSIKDLVYTYSPKTGADPAQLNFSTQTISTFDDGGVTCDPAHRPLGSYAVYTALQPDPGAADSQAGTLELSLNGYYIYYHHVQSACGNGPAEYNQLTAPINALLTAVQHAQSM